MGQEICQTRVGNFSYPGFIGIHYSFAICSLQYFFVDGKLDGVYQSIIAFNFQWLEFSPGLSIDMGILLDPVSVMMLGIVTFVSLMVHIFSLEYMKGEERFATYYAFLSLFTFSMLGLVLSSNIFQIYIFWERGIIFLSPDWVLF